MKPVTERHKQWLWFALLWCGGVVATGLLSWAVRGIVTFL